MEYAYNTELEVLNLTSDSGILNTIRLPKKDIEGLYFFLWALLVENDDFDESEI
jgi:hypothetical protein